MIITYDYSPEDQLLTSMEVPCYNSKNEKQSLVISEMRVYLLGIKVDVLNTSAVGRIGIFLRLFNKTNVSLPEEVHLIVLTPYVYFITLSRMDVAYYGGHMDSVIFLLDGYSELYPFDYYFLNISIYIDSPPNLSIEIRNATKITVECISIAEGFIHKQAETKREKNKMHITFVLSRRTWFYLPFLVFFVLIYFTMGCIIFLDVRSHSLGFRFYYIIVLLMLLVFYHLIVTTEIPPPKHFIPLLNLLVLSVMSALAAYVIGTIIAYTTKISHVIADTCAMIISIFLTSYFIQDLIFFCRVYLYRPVLEQLIKLLWILASCFVSSFIIYIAVRILVFRRERGIALPRLRISHWYLAMRMLTIIIILLHACSAILTLHWVSIIGPEIELNPLWRYLFKALGDKSYIAPIVSTSLLIASLEYLYRRRINFDIYSLTVFGFIIQDFINNVLFISSIAWIDSIFAKLAELIFNQPQNQLVMERILIDLFAIGALSYIIAYVVCKFVHKKIIIHR